MKYVFAYQGRFDSFRRGVSSGMVARKGQENWRSPPRSGKKFLEGGRDEIIKTSISLQDLRRKIYPKAKSDLAGIGGVRIGNTEPESAAWSIGIINF